ncbi:Trk system potassium transporter TrkA [Alkalibaculum sp. M08DMB]|uniref:Trk system potassium uptake protein TrkA n=1 Tax=Alkalibaculum sporogenes TaxID=2655001 RepID=A0A6A7K521_9FIRM|nr:Trk system potassium transporter TrkA [Alkalibaculum sporogenes]MPW24480.1 Trk system potassium transporter TrkA [Alkalibaculum sporogenes]
MKVLIVGAGKLGYNIAQTLSSADEITLVDINGAVLEKINEHLDVMTIKGSGANVDVLKDLGISNFDLVIATATSDELNIIVCMTAKKLGCKKAIARIRNPEYTGQLSFIKSTMDIDFVVNPELAVADEITRYIAQKYNFFHGKYAGGSISVLDCKASEIDSFIDKKIKDISHVNYITIVAILRNGETIIPYGETIIEKEDTVFIVGKSKDIDHLLKSKKTSQNGHLVKKAMILGGGKVGYYLAKRLNKLGIDVKLIEEDYNRCIQLSELLEDVLIIHGNGTDIDLLEDEDLDKMDAFIGVTGHDEDNLFMSLRAKQLNVKKVIAKVSRQSHKHISERLGIDIALNPIEITAAEIVKFIQGGQVVSVSFLLGGNVEVIEMIVDDQFKYIGKTISEIPFPKGVIVGAMMQDKNVIIPNGDTRIILKDRLIIFSLIDQFPSIERFFTL